VKATNEPTSNPNNPNEQKDNYEKDAKLKPLGRKKKFYNFEVEHQS